MNNSPRYLLGKGESLSEEVTLSAGGGEKVHPYSFEAAKTRLAQPIAKTVSALQALPAEACPNDEAVAILTLHPSYIAKSYFPDQLLEFLGLRAVGNRSALISPEKRNQRQAADKLTTVEIFAAGKRRFFEQWSSHLHEWSTLAPGAEQLRNLETVYAESPEARVRQPEDEPSLLEAILHAEGARDNDLVEHFRTYVESLGGKALVDSSLQTGGLCFIGVRAAKELVPKIAAFSFLRGLRPMPGMRNYSPFRAGARSFTTQLPNAEALNPHIRVAILDAGMPANPDLRRWVNASDAGDVDTSTSIEGVKHGLAVTSAALFGPIDDGTALNQPLTMVDHFRVADDNDSLEQPNYYKILNRIVDVLRSEHYDYVNISVGPDISMEDDIIHAWTAKLDELFSHGKTLAFYAAGNTGQKLPPRSRLSPPADGVNAIGIGSCDTGDGNWSRAPYSSIGPGRSPGVIKPDIVSFGGALSNEFGVLVPEPIVSACGATGTSFASPNAMRIALGAAAYFGYALKPLAIKALLIHHAKRDKLHDVNHVGWGRIPSSYMDLVTCEPNAVHVVYQGVLQPRKTLRARIPVPHSFGTSRVQITATICYATEVEPQYPASYTRAGLDVFFRPHVGRRRSPTQQHADTAPFFRASDYGESDAELRSDALKWETVMSRSKRFNPTSLLEPAFDLHYVPRQGGGNAQSPSEILYGMIITVRQANNISLYDEIALRYRTILQPLQPRVSIPVRV
ncbi:MAG: S8 family peptidase [Candidatus Cybelea sp.]